MSKTLLEKFYLKMVFYDDRDPYDKVKMYCMRIFVPVLAPLGIYERACYYEVIKADMFPLMGFGAFSFSPATEDDFNSLDNLCTVHLENIEDKVFLM